MDTDQKSAVAIKGKPGRPFGFSPKREAQAKSTVIVFTTEAGEVIPLKLKDAERIAEQVNKIRLKLG